MLRFKEETGKEVTEISGSLSDMCAYLYCCTASACKKDGVKFDMELMDFADSLTPEDLAQWTDAVNGAVEQAPAAVEDDGGEKKLGILEMLGVAVGCVGMSYDGFCSLTPEEFSHIYKAYSERADLLYRDDWNRARMIGVMALRPYAKKGLTPDGLLPFPWDERKPEPAEEAPVVSKEDALKRFEEVLEMVGKG